MNLGSKTSLQTAAPVLLPGWYIAPSVTMKLQTICIRRIDLLLLCPVHFGWKLFGGFPAETLNQLPLIQKNASVWILT